MFPTAWTSRPPTPAPSPPQPLSAALDAASAAIRDATAHLKTPTLATTLEPAATVVDDGFELVDFDEMSAADALSPGDVNATNVREEQQVQEDMHARITQLTLAVAQLTAVMQASSSPASSAGMQSTPSSPGMTPGEFPPSPSPSSGGTVRRPLPAPLEQQRTNSSDNGGGISTVSELRSLSARMSRLEHAVAHALAGMRALHSGHARGGAFAHSLVVRDVHAWGVRVTLDSPNATVRDLRRKLAAMAPAHVAGDARLVWAGHLLDDGEFVAERVPDGGVVVVMAASCGSSSTVGAGSARCGAPAVPPRSSRDGN